MEQPDRFVQHSLRTSMFFPQSRLFVSGNPKAAGTTLRWWLLEAHGIDVHERTSSSWWGESAPFQTVWDDAMRLEYVWPQLSEEAQRDALESDDVVTVMPIRNPVTRTFSAWSGKFLTCEPYYNDNLPNTFVVDLEPVASAEAITEQFETFMGALADVVKAEGFDSLDVHLWPQSQLLAREPAGPTIELRQESMSEGLDAITAHLRERGVEVQPAPRINETVVPYLAELITDSALAVIQELYHDDFARWSYSEDRPPSSKRELDIDWLNDVRGRNSRYGALHRALMEQAREREQLQRDINDARIREEQLTESASWRVTEPLRWVSDRARKR